MTKKFTGFFNLFGFVMKISDGHPCHFYIERPPPPGMQQDNVDKTPLILIVIIFLMDEFEESSLEKETNDSYNNFYQNQMQYNERENAFIKNNR